jgi:hypothetical protein
LSIYKYLSFPQHSFITYRAYTKIEYHQTFHDEKLYQL